MKTVKAHLPVLVPALVLALTPASARALAHHGDAGRYEATLTSVSGKLIELQLVNPHSIILVEVADANGGTVLWRGELGPPRTLRGWCWDSETIDVGDTITLVGRALKNGRPYMTLSEEARVLDAEGQEIFRGNEPGEPDPPGPCAEP